MQAAESAGGGEVTDLTTQAASDDELRRRATQGDQRAIAELARRGSRCEETKKGEQRAFKLTQEERRAIFASTLKVLRRPRKPDQEAGHEIVVSKTRGGKQIVDRSTGETIDIPSQPRLWITIKGWHLKAGDKEWETAVTVRDTREQNRVLANGLGGIPREPGLKTRWGQTVDAEGKARPKRVPKTGEQREHWTVETERGYGGRGGMERSVDGDFVPATGVDDATLDDYSRRVAEENRLRRRGKHNMAEKLREESKVAKEYRRGNRSGGNAANRRAERAEKRLAAAA